MKVQKNLFKVWDWTTLTYYSFLNSTKNCLTWLQFYSTGWTLGSVWINGFLIHRSVQWYRKTGRVLSFLLFTRNVTVYFFFLHEIEFKWINVRERSSSSFYLSTNSNLLLLRISHPFQTNKEPARYHSFCRTLQPSLSSI